MPVAQSAGLPDLPRLARQLFWAGWLPCPCLSGMLCLPAAAAAAFAQPLSIETVKNGRSLDPCQSKLLRMSARATPVEPFH